MKTDFAILWIDDNKDFVESLKPGLVKWLEDLGFDLDIRWRKSEPGVFEELAKGDIELIAVDYKLPGKKGDEIIKDIRSKEYYQDVIFYSQVVSEENLPGHLDGVFFSARNDIKDIIKHLIELKLQRSSDLATFRGWIIADAIELEVAMKYVLAKCFGKHEAVFMERILEEEGIFDFGKLHKVLNGILKDHLKGKSGPEVAELETCKKTLDSFVDEIIHVRNALAHQLHEFAQSGHKIVKTKTSAAKAIVFDKDQCIAIRRNIRKHRKNLNDLRTIIKF